MFSQVNIDKVYRKLAKIERDKAVAVVKRKDVNERYGLSVENWIDEIDYFIDQNRNKRPQLNYRQILNLADDEIQKNILQDRLDDDPSMYY